MCCRLGKWRQRGGALELCIGVKSSGKSVESVFALAAFLVIQDPRLGALARARTSAPSDIATAAGSGPG
jgi:hypothetical protein